MFRNREVIGLVGSTPTQLFINGLSKRFGPIHALKNVSIEFRGGEIHIILGENGAGKTTLAKILSGIYRLDEGEITINGTPVKIRNTKDALRNGIAIVSQYPKLIEEMTVAENLLIALDYYGPLTTPRSVIERAVELADKYGLHIDMDKYIYSLSFSERQRVEILKALLLNPSVLILDEPTTLLTPNEKRGLYRFIEMLKQEGKIVIVITHKIDEALEIGDRITILRDGKVIVSLPKEKLTKDMIIKYMFGDGAQENKYNQIFIRRDESNRNAVLVVEGVDVIDDYGYIILKNVNLKVFEGEIVGVAGIAGTGLKELGESIYGLRKIARGQIVINGRSVSYMKREEIANNVGFIPDNIVKTLVLELEVEKNFRLKKSLWSITLDAMERYINKFRIKAESPNQNTGTLSGGNLQKLVVSREVALKPKLLIATNPTKALDHISINVIHGIFREYASNGGAVLILSEDIDEVLRISDRIYVISNNTIKPVDSNKDARKLMMELLT